MLEKVNTTLFFSVVFLLQVGDGNKEGKEKCIKRGVKRKDVALNGS